MRTYLSVDPGLRDRSATYGRRRRPGGTRSYLVAIGAPPVDLNRFPSRRDRGRTGRIPQLLRLNRYPEACSTSGPSRPQARCRPSRGPSYVLVPGSGPAGGAPAPAPARPGGVRPPPGSVRTPGPRPPAPLGRGPGHPGRPARHGGAADPPTGTPPSTWRPSRASTSPTAAPSPPATGSTSWPDAWCTPPASARWTSLVLVAALASSAGAGLTVVAGRDLGGRWVGPGGRPPRGHVPLRLVRRLRRRHLLLRPGHRPPADHPGLAGPPPLVARGRGPGGAGRGRRLPPVRRHDVPPARPAGGGRIGPPAARGRRSPSAAGAVAVAAWFVPMVLAQPGGLATWSRAARGESEGAARASSVLDHAAGGASTSGRSRPTRWSPCCP